MDNQNNQNRNKKPNQDNRQGFPFIILVTLLTAILLCINFREQRMHRRLLTMNS